MGFFPDLQNPNSLYSTRKAKSWNVYDPIQAEIKHVVSVLLAHLTDKVSHAGRFGIHNWGRGEGLLPAMGALGSFVRQGHSFP